jgi:hypothetical protein
MAELSKASPGKPLFYPVKLHPGNPCENNDQPDKQKKGFYGSKISLFRRLVGAVYEKDNDEVYEIAKHKNCYYIKGNPVLWARSEFSGSA